MFTYVLDLITDMWHAATTTGTHEITYDPTTGTIHGMDY